MLYYFVTLEKLLKHLLKFSFFICKELDSDLYGFFWVK